VESEFRGVKEFVMHPLDLTDGIEVSVNELLSYFIEVK